MFYISDISGAQSPYTEELYRIQRDVQLASLHTNLTDPALSGEAVSQTGNTGGLPTQGVQNQPSGVASDAAVGTAGASGMYRGRGAGDAEVGESETIEQKGERVRRRTVNQVRPAARIHREGEEVEEYSPSKGKVNPYAKLDSPKPLQRALLASQIMSSPVQALTKEMPASEAGKLFRERRFRHLPVVSEENTLIGILSDRDYLSAKEETVAVEELMKTNVICARPNTEIRKIAEVMFHERIGAMPIVDESNELVGILTRSDILCAVVNEAPLEIWV